MPNEIAFSDDRTAFAIKTDKGIYINTTGKQIDPKTLKPHTMKCCKCGKIYKNATLNTVPHPCECGGIGFESIDNEAVI